MPPDWRGVVAGAGKLHGDVVTRLSQAEVLGVRGMLTAERLGLFDCVIGDLGLLANELVPLEDKIYDLGLVPHWSDHSLEKREEFLKYNPRVIRVADNPIEVIAQIGRCKKIVASSLHGIVVADSFHIPRRIELAPKMVSHIKQEGGIFKWQDYSSGIGCEFKVGLTCAPDKYFIVDKQSELFDMLSVVKRIFKYNAD